MKINVGVFVNVEMIKLFCSEIQQNQRNLSKHDVNKKNRKQTQKNEYILTARK